MPPKKSTTAAPKKAAGAAPAHGSYIDMVKEAIINLKERNGSSRQAIKKYIQANNNLEGTTEAMFTSHLNRAILSGEKSGDFARPKGPSGPVKLEKKGAKPAAKPVVAKKETKAAPKPAKKAPATKTKATVKKPAVKKATTITKKAPAAKKPAAKPKANAGRPRKTAKAAPAVSDEPALILGKTKSGRITKTKAPAAKPAKKAAPKKAPAKKATPKKATPKKAAV